ncbi:uncharacterized protein METZ01_LOCUS55411 [marine metagenome]|uniref:Uncharacterized protein n=1 Tax=marine metagenome TaxID=408172 RepID=A0A381SJQ2_9ZZZZ
MVTNPGAGRHHPKVVKRTLPPSEKTIPFAVTLHFNRHVLLERIGGAEVVDHHAVINHKIHRRKGVNHTRVVAGVNDGAAHGG